MTKNIETVHLAIDVQNSFLHMPYWTTDGFETYKHNQLALIELCQSVNIPTLQIFHIGKQGPFKKETGHTIPMDFMPTNLDGVFEKTVHNALTDSGLDEWLKAHNVRNIIISGLRTEQCCETTTRVASDFGYHIDFVTEATHTFAMTHPTTGKTYSASEIKQKTELVLAGRFAEIHTVDSLLKKYKG